MAGFLRRGLFFKGLRNVQRATPTRTTSAVRSATTGNAPATQTTTTAPGNPAAQRETKGFGGGFTVGQPNGAKPPPGFGPKATIATTTTSTTTIPYLTPVQMVIVIIVVITVALILVLGTIFGIRHIRKKNKREPDGQASGQRNGQTPAIHVDNMERNSSALSPCTPSSPTKGMAPRLPLASRTFATSNYKRFYDDAEPAPFQHDLLHAVNDMLVLYARRMNPTLDEDTVKGGVHTLMKKIQNDAFKDDEALQDDVDTVAEYLWTGTTKHRIVNRMELCSVMNAVIRDDFADEIAAAAMIFRSINQRRVNRVSGGATLDVQSYPPNGEMWRGGGFRDEFKPFFQRVKGKKYRVPGFLATSTDKAVAVGFVYKASKKHACALWHVTVDKRGKLDAKYRVQHMSFVSKTLIAGEHEYLFAPYSVFTLVSVEWSESPKEEHRFTIKAARDNQDEDEDLPLAPWY